MISKINNIRRIEKRVREGMQHSISAYCYKQPNWSAKKYYIYLNSIHKDVRSSAIRKKIRKFKEPVFDLSVIMTTYNRDAIVERCIKSIISQKTSFNVEYIFVNDGSLDNTRGILEKYRKYANVRIINQKNTELSGARKRAIDIAKGEYVIFVDDDDLLLDGAIEALLAATNNEKYDIVEGAMIRVDLNGKESKMKNNIEGEIFQLLGNMKGFATGKLYRKKIFEKIIFPLNYWFEDSINSGLIYSNNLKAFAIDKYVYKYCSTEGSITASCENPKNLDSLYITMQLLKDRKKLGLVFSQENYEYFLKMIYITYQRTKVFDNNVRYSIFQIQRYMYHRYYEEFHTEKTNHFKGIEKAIVKNDFKRYVRYCELHI